MIDDNKSAIIRVKDREIEVRANVGDTVFSRLCQNNGMLQADCGGKGTCGKCKVQVLSGNVEPATEAECKHLSDMEIKQGYRLACKLIVKDSITLNVAHRQSERESVNRKQDLVQVPEWFISNPSSVFEYGVAFDIGTTTVVGMLWNLQSGELIDAYAMTNPQKCVGADVISRIQYCIQSKENKQHLYEMIRECLNQILTQFSERIEERNLITKVSIVGNTAMSCIAQNISVQELIKPPFPKYVYEEMQYKGSNNELGLEVGEETQIICLPGIGGHIGSDITAMVVATNIAHERGNTLAIDIGTNGEIVLAKDGKLVACSTAAGPAFEGASINYGMRACKGAIEGVVITESGVQLRIIDAIQAEGICGSGLIEAVAAMLEVGVIDETGKIRDMREAIEAGVPKQIATRLQSTEQGMQFVLQFRYAKDPIVLTQNDVREVQLAKSAIYSGMETLMNEMKMKKEELDSVYLAGAFGSYLNIESARRIGLIPNIELSRIHSVGNAAGVGASMTVLSEVYWKEAKEIADQTTHIELSMSDVFQEAFIRNMNF